MVHNSTMQHFYMHRLILFEWIGICSSAAISILRLSSSPRSLSIASNNLQSLSSDSNDRNLSALPIEASSVQPSLCSASYFESGAFESAAMKVLFTSCVSSTARSLNIIESGDEGLSASFNLALMLKSGTLVKHLMVFSFAI